MKKKKKWKKGVMALKLDMSMTYNRLEWDFIIGVLSSMGFSNSMVSLFHWFISMASYQILVNRKPSRGFIP